MVYTGASLIGVIMPTKLRRVTLSLPPELDQALARFGEVTHGSQAKFIVECLEGSIPVIHGICDAIETAKGGNVKGAHGMLVNQVKNVESDLEQLKED